MADLDEYDHLLGEKTGGPAAEAGKLVEKSSKSSSRSKHRERERSRDRERDRDRDKDKDKDRRRRSRSSDYRRSRRDGDNDIRPSGRRRSRSRERRHREPERADRGGGRSRDSRSRDRRVIERRRETTPPEVRLQRERERELKELERATRTVFAYNLNIKADERDIYDFFCKAGEVTDIRVITDRHTKRSKGLAYVEFKQQEQVFVALAMTGQILLGQPVMVKPAEAEKNLAWEAQQAAKQGTQEAEALLGLGLGLEALSTQSAAAAGAAVPQSLRLQITGFKPGLAEGEIRQIFEPFGPVDSVNVVRDGAGQPISIAYVVFRSSLDGTNAMQHWHGKSLLDHVLNVTVAPVTAADKPGGVAGVAVVGELDDEDFKLNTQTRAALMSRLASSAGIMQPTAALAAANGAAGGAAAAALLNPLLSADALALNPAAVNPLLAMTGVGLPGMVLPEAVQQGRLGPPSPIPTPCLLLTNMFDPAQQSGEEWVADLTEDVRDECSKYGKLLHVFVDKDSQGFVYLKYDSVEGAQAASKVLHGRFYNGKMIQVAYQFVQTFNQHFNL